MQTILLYGATDTYKTSQIGLAAEYIFKSTGKVTRLVTADSGIKPVRNQIKSGVIQVINLKECAFPLSSLVKISRGMWPTEIDFETGSFNEKTLQVDKHLGVNEDGAVGAYAIEGLYMIGQLMYGDLIRKQRATGEPLQAEFVEEGVQFADGSRGTYKFVQTWTMGYLKEFFGLGTRYKFSNIIVTSHEGKGKDPFTGVAILGPMVIGQSATGKMAQEFEHTLHHDTYEYAEGPTGKQVRKTGVRAFFQKHPDSELPKQYWPAKLTVDPKVIPKLNAQWPGGYYPVALDTKGNYVSGLHTLLEFLDRSEQGE